MVGDDAIDLLGHGAVEGPQPGLDMCDGNVQLGGHEGAGQRRVGIAVDQNAVGAQGFQHRFELLKHGACHRPMPTAMDLQIVVGLLDAQLGKEDVGHLGIEMLAGMDQYFSDRAGLGERLADRSYLDELRSGADDSGNRLHGLVSLWTRGSTKDGLPDRWQKSTVEV